MNSEKVDGESYLNMRSYKGFAKGKFKKLLKGKYFGPKDNTKSLKNNTVEAKQPATH